MAAAVVDEVAGEENRVGVALGGAVGLGEIFVPVAVVRVAHGGAGELEVLLVDVGADVDVRIGELADAEDGGGIPPDEQRVQNLGANARCALGAVGLVQATVFEFVFVQQALRVRTPERTEALAAWAREALE